MKNNHLCKSSLLVFISVIFPLLTAALNPGIASAGYGDENVNEITTSVLTPGKVLESALLKREADMKSAVSAPTTGEAAVPVLRTISRTRGYSGDPRISEQAVTGRVHIPRGPDATFGADIQVKVPDTSSKEIHQAMASDSKGNLYTAWQDDSLAHDYIQVYRSGDGGLTWSAFGNIQNASADLKEPSIAVGEGIANVLLIAYIVDDGETIPYPEVATSPLDRTAFTIHSVPYYAYEGFAKPVIWTDSLEWDTWFAFLTAEGIEESLSNNINVVFWRSVDNGSTWTDPPLIPFGSTDTDAWRDPDGTYGTTKKQVFIATYNDTDNTLYTAISKDSGNSFPTTIAISTLIYDPSHPVDPDIEAAVANDNVMLVFTHDDTADGPDDDDIGYIYSTSAGTSWPTPLTNLPGASDADEHAPELTANEGGGSWHLTFTSDSDVYYSRRPQDLSLDWQANADLVTDTGSASSVHPKKGIASIWATDKAGILWSDNRDGSTDHDTYFDFDRGAVISDDNYEENDARASAYYPGYDWEATYLSTISGAGIQYDDDWYEIDVESGNLRVQIDCTFSHADGNLDICLYDSSGSQVICSRSVDDNEHIDTVVAVEGKYYIKVAGTDVGNTYELSYVDFKIPVDNYQVEFLKNGLIDPSKTLTGKADTGPFDADWDPYTKITDVWIAALDNSNNSRRVFRWVLNESTGSKVWTYVGGFTSINASGISALSIKSDTELIIMHKDKTVAVYPRAVAARHDAIVTPTASFTAQTFVNHIGVDGELIWGSHGGDCSRSNIAVFNDSGAPIKDFPVYGSYLTGVSRRDDYLYVYNTGRSSLGSCPRDGAESWLMKYDLNGSYINGYECNPAVHACIPEHTEALSWDGGHFWATAGTNVYRLEFPEGPELLVDIKANNSDFPVTMRTYNMLSLDVSLFSGSRRGQNADWWALADSPLGWYYYHLESNTWRQGQEVTHQSSLFDLSPFRILDSSGLPAGLYNIYFGVDLNMNSSIDIDQLYYDNVNVRVNP